MAPKSILRNAPGGSGGEYSPSNSPSDIDRNQVLENTRANAQLHDVGAVIKQHDDSKDVEQSEENYQNENGLKWDEANIYLNEQDRTAKMKIDEPKTPFQGAIGDSEYYLPDEEEEAVKTRDGERKIAVDELDEFSLGEPEYKNETDPIVQNDRIERVVNDDDDKDEDDEEDRDETAEEKHRRFEEKRKAHYHMKANPLKQPMPPVEDEE